MVFVSDPAAPIVSAEDMRHLLDALRLRPGELVIAGDGAGAWTPCRVSQSAASGSRGADPAGLLIPEGPPVLHQRVEPLVTVAFTPTKGDRPEWTVAKLTELGVDRIVPLRTDRSIVRWEGDRAAKAVERLNRVAREAAGQSRRPWLPDVVSPVGLDDLADLCGTEPSLADWGAEPPDLAHPVVAVGPEGGWSDAERGRFARRVSLGTTVLRAETAAVVAGAMLGGLRCGVVASLARPRSVFKTGQEQ